MLSQPIIEEEPYEYDEDLEEGGESDHVDGEVLEDGEIFTGFYLSCHEKQTKS